jgi:4-aminobutyrate aminotransferase-like enzyme
MAKKRERDNGTGTVYPRKNKQGKIISYLGAYHGRTGSAATSPRRRKASARGGSGRR